MRTANIGSLTADPHPNHVVNFNQAKVIMAFARACPTSKGGRVDHQNHDFFNVTMATKLKKGPLFFSAGEQEMIMNAYEEYKTIIMAYKKQGLCLCVCVSVCLCVCVHL